MSEKKRQDATSNAAKTDHDEIAGKLSVFDMSFQFWLPVKKAFDKSPFEEQFVLLQVTF